MKKFIALMSIAVFIFVLSPDASAWEVALENGTSEPVKFEIYGEHLFWEQVECEKVVPAATVDKCVLPGAICPSSAQFSMVSGGTGVKVITKTTRFAQCWNHRAIITEDKFNRIMCSFQEQK